MNLKFFSSIVDSITDAPIEETDSSILDFNQIVKDVVTWISTNGVRLLVGLLALFIAFKLINFFSKRLNNLLIKRKVDKTVVKITHRIARTGLKVLAFLVFLGIVGIDTAGIGAAVASFAVTIGLALQGSLSNIAGGIVILVTRPFRIGDFIETEEILGTVDDIRAFHTVLITPDNKVVSLPNGVLSNSNIINYSLQKTRRIDITFSISYAEDFKRAEKVILEVARNNPMILEVPEPTARISEHAESSINIISKVWVKNEDYWDVKFQMLEDVKAAFDANNIEIPFKQVDVHIDKKD